MSCVFCESFFHVSQNCDVYILHDDRRRIAEQNGYCSDCLTKKENPLHRFKCCNNCFKYKKCYICFSQDHHTAYCINAGWLGPKVYCPKIDQIILPRFMKMLYKSEQIFLTFTFPDVYRACQPDPFAITRYGVFF